MQFSLAIKPSETGIAEKRSHIIECEGPLTLDYFRDIQLVGDALLDLLNGDGALVPVREKPR